MTSQQGAVPLSTQRCQVYCRPQLLCSCSGGSYGFDDFKLDLLKAPSGPADFMGDDDLWEQFMAHSPGAPPLPPVHCSFSVTAGVPLLPGAVCCNLLGQLYRRHLVEPHTRQSGQ